MPRRSRLLAGGPVSVFVLLALACSSDDAPVAPTSTPNSNVYNAPAAEITIQGPASVLTGFTARLDATAKLTSGAVFTRITAEWSTDRADVATIDNRGVLTGHAPGTTTVTAAYRGASGNFTMQVLARPASRPFPAQANLTISYAPNPVPGSTTACGSLNPFTPSWRYSMTIAETGGVGFTMKVGDWKLLDEAGRMIYEDGETEDEYFAPNSVFTEDICLNLFGHPYGAIQDTLEGIDDNGNQLAFTGHLEFASVPRGVSLSLGPFPVIAETLAAALQRPYTRETGDLDAHGTRTGARHSAASQR